METVFCLDSLDKLLPGWYHLRTPLSHDHSLSERPGSLALRGNAYKLVDVECPAVLLRKQTFLLGSWTTRLDYSPSTTNQEAGLTVFWSCYAFITLAIRKASTAGRQIILRWTNEESDDFKVSSNQGRASDENRRLPLTCIPAIQSLSGSIRPRQSIAFPIARRKRRDGQVSENRCPTRCWSESDHLIHRTPAHILGCLRRDWRRVQHGILRTLSMSRSIRDDGLSSDAQMQKSVTTDVCTCGDRGVRTQINHQPQIPRIPRFQGHFKNQGLANFAPKKENRKNMSAMTRHPYPGKGGLTADCFERSLIGNSQQLL